jgi:hypothetical protein
MEAGTVGWVFKDKAQSSQVQLGSADAPVGTANISDVRRVGGAAGRPCLLCTPFAHQLLCFAGD